ncbi:hypothetical protein LCGC14_0329740 [marine sediment metagenome]|uniref:HNH domain-containing protein n=1 Tax=marine sediment metagenome TaxID=412755 RepID=A0A0F9W403_9ZZZZ
MSNKDRVNAIKRERGCQVCGESEPCCLDFHHRDPITKFKSVSKLTVGYSWEWVEQEIKKCDVLCSNCHRKMMWMKKTGSIDEVPVAPCNLTVDQNKRVVELGKEKGATLCNHATELRLELKNASAAG